MKARVSFFVLAVPALLALCGSASSDVPTQGLISYWTFDEGSGVIAYDSAGTNHGTIYGAQWTTGQIDGALSFDHVDDYVEVGDDPSLRFTQYDSFSVCFWAKPSSGVYVFSKLRAYAQHGVFGYAIRWFRPPKFQFIIEKSRVANVFVDTSDNSAPAGSWYYVTAVYDNKDMKIYLNGELKGTNFFGYDTGSTSPDKNLAIGVRSFDSTLEHYFGGIIDDVMIFDRALSAEEIWQLYMPYRPKENLVVNGGFDTTEIISGGWPSTYGDWSGNPSYILPRYGDVWPFEGSQMLYFVGTSHFGSGGATESQVYQIVDVSAFRDLIAEGRATASASAYFNRVPGDAETDTEFYLDIRAFEGDPCLFPTLQDMGGMHLAAASASVFTDGDPATWEQCEVQLVLPTNTDYVVVGVHAMENIYNDHNWPEFDGHCADGASLTITVEPNVPEGVYHVDGVNGNDLNDGLSPETAFATIQKGIDSAVDGDEIIVADDTYTGTGNKNLDFGGRAITVRSENGPEFTTIDCENDGRAFTFHTDEAQDSVVAGFTITRGSSYNGGAISCDNSSPTIKDCIFSANQAEHNGGAMYVVAESSPVIENCVFKENRAGEHAGAAFFSNSDAVVSGCIFIKNVGYNSSADGGAIWNGGGISPTIVNCLFVGNTALESGGAIRNDRSSPTIINCTFNGNSATYGGAMHNAPYSSPIIINCIFWGNDASSGDEIDNNGDCYPTISYCDIEGGWNGPKVVNRSGSSVIDGGGNIDDVPCFADSNSGDYHLKSQAGRWDPNSQSWVQDDVTSLCIDAGVPMSPIGDEPFPNGGIINMGACGGTAEASKSYFGQPVCEVVVAGDINGDCKVNFLDFRLMTLHWLEDNTSPSN